MTNAKIPLGIPTKQLFCHCVATYCHIGDDQYKGNIKAPRLAQHVSAEEPVF